MGAAPKAIRARSFVRHSQQPAATPGRSKFLYPAEGCGGPWGTQSDPRRGGGQQIRRRYWDTPARQRAFDAPHALW